MKKTTRLLYLSLGIIVVGLVIIFLGTNVFMDKAKEIVSEKESDRKVYSTGISMMLEIKYASGEYQETTDTTWAQAIESGYLFNETMSKCENGSILTWNETNKTVMFSGNVSDRCYVYFDKKPTIADKCIGKNMGSCIAENYELDTSIYYHDGVGAYGAYEAGDNSCRYSGANPSNYVCLGEDCTNSDNLYRIIGVFDGRVKLIKYDYATSDMLGTDGAYNDVGNHLSTYKGKQTLSYWYKWNSLNSNVWSESDLNTVNLNKNYWDNLGSIWQAYIDDNTWIVGGNTWTTIGTNAGAKNVYTAEITSPAVATTYKAKIGLMYVSDYMYAANPTQDNTWSNLASNDYSSIKNYNWMYMGANEWIISPQIYNTINRAFHLYNTGNVSDSIVDKNSYDVRPCFFLKASVKIKSGIGTQSDPYRIDYTPNLISFTVKGSSYQAEEGMTWEEWIDSSYNTNSFEICHTDQICTGFLNLYKESIDCDSFVKKSDVIVDGFVYATGPELAC